MQHFRMPERHPRYLGQFPVYWYQILWVCARLHYHTHSKTEWISKGYTIWFPDVLKWNKNSQIIGRWPDIRSRTVDSEIEKLQLLHRLDGRFHKNRSRTQESKRCKSHNILIVYKSYLAYEAEEHTYRKVTQTIY